MRPVPADDPDIRRQMRAAGVPPRHHDYRPRMLRVFLYARALARDGFRLRKAHRDDLCAELAARTGLPFSTVRAAFAGRCPDDAARAAIWAALGHAPGAEALGFDAQQRAA